MASPLNGAARRLLLAGLMAPTLAAAQGSGPVDLMLPGDGAAPPAASRGPTAPEPARPAQPAPAPPPAAAPAPAPVAAPAPVQPAPAPVPAAAPAAPVPSAEPPNLRGRGSVNALFEQANYWRSRGDSERALGALERVLAVEPTNAEALSLAIESSALLGRTTQANEFLAQLRRAVPAGDPRIGRAETTVAVANDGAPTLAEARRLAAAGRQGEAVQRYRQLFRGNQPPPFLRREYLEVLAGAGDSGYEEATAEMRRLVAANPTDNQLALTYATLLTYREENRDEAINILRRLARQPATQTAARQQLRQVYLWEPASPVLAERIEELLTQMPSDAELQAKLTDARTSRRAASRVEAWDLAGQRRTAEAERIFRSVLEANPNDAEALMGLATMAGMQFRYDEMRQLRARAIAISPDREAEFMANTQLLDVEAERQRTGGGPTGRVTGGRGGFGGGRGTGGGPVVLPASAQGWQALQRGQLDQADRLARRAAQGSGDEAAQGNLILGQIALRRNDMPEAERRFRAALQLRPGDLGGTQGLYYALLGQDRTAEAEELQRRTNLAVPPQTGNAVRRAFQIRDTASRMASDAEAISALNEALQLDPGNIYVRLDLARRLRRTGDPQGARVIESQMAQSGQPDALGVAALLASEDDRFGEAAGYLSRIPDRARPGEQNRFLSQLRAEAAVRGWEQQARMGMPAGRTQLMAIAGRPDPSGASAANATRAFGRLNDRAGAVAAARAGLLANPRLDADGRITLAAALLEANAQAEALQLLATAEGQPGLSDEGRRQARFVREQSAAGRADRRTAQGDVNGAYEELAPYLRGPEASPTISTALMRSYARARRYAEAKQVADALLARDPLDADIRASAVDLAVEMEEYGVAEALLAEGRRFDVSSPNLLNAEARVARARRNPVRELRALEAATRMRMEQLRVGGQEQQAALAAEYLSPARSGLRPVDDMTDPQTARMLRELSRARDEAAAWIQAGVQVTGRTGQAGLSRSTTIATPVEVTAPVPGLQGRMSLATGSVTMIQGNLSNNLVSGRQFGTNALANGRPFGRPDSEQVGAPVSVGYVGQYLRGDIGATPLGFRRTNVVGGVEVVVPVSQRVNLRVVGENRAITDSVLSYGGQRDTLSGTTWGAVTRAGGRLQVEASLTDRIGIYGGGSGYSITGRNVKDNSSYELGGGVYTSLRNTPRESLSVGLDLRYQAYAQNLGFFTLGHGGYFSPQRSTTAQVQVDWRRQVGDWTLRGIASLGWQWYYSRSAPLFPNDPELQGQAQAIANVDSTQPSFYGAQRSSGPTGSLYLNAEYAVSPALRVGAAGRFQRVGEYQDLAGLLYLRYRLDPARRDISPLLRDTPPATPYGSFPFPGAVNQGRPEPVALPVGAARPTW